MIQFEQSGFDGRSTRDSKEIEAAMSNDITIPDSDGRSTRDSKEIEAG